MLLYAHEDERDSRIKSKRVSNRNVAKKAGYARNTVNKAIKQINEVGLTYNEVRNLSDSMLREYFNVSASSRRNQAFSCSILSYLQRKLVKPSVTMQ